MPDKIKQDVNAKGSTRGFASMPRDKVVLVARKGGITRAEKAGSEGMSALGKKGGEARKAKLGSIGYSELGKKGGRRTHKSKKSIMVYESPAESPDLINTIDKNSI